MSWKTNNIFYAAFGNTITKRIKLCKWKINTCIQTCMETDIKQDSRLLLFLLEQTDPVKFILCAISQCALLSLFSIFIKKGNH